MKYLVFDSEQQELLAENQISEKLKYPKPGLNAGRCMWLRWWPNSSTYIN